MRIAWIDPGFQGGADEPGIPALNGLARSVGSRHDLRVLAVRYPPRSERYRVVGAHVQSFGHMAPSGTGALARRAASARRWARVLETLAALHRRSPFAVVHGFCLTARSPVALANALCTRPRAATAPGATCARNEARRQTVAHLALPRVAERFLDIYQALADGGRAGRAGHDDRHRGPGVTPRVLLHGCACIV